MPIEYLDSDEAVGNLEVVVPKKDQRGVTIGERIAIKNLASNPAAVKSFLESRGYQTRRYGAGMYDFAIRKGASEDWKVIDPNIAGTSLGEFFLDIADFASDVGIGALSSLGVASGSALGPAGAVAGGGAGAAIGEGIRQQIGELVGMEENIDPSQIALQGALGGAIPAAGAAARRALNLAAKVAPGVGRIGRLAGAKVAGIRSTHGMSGEEALNIAASRDVFRGKPVPLASFHDAALRYRKLVEGLSNAKTHPFPERMAVQELVDDAGAPTINMLPVTEKLRSMILKEVTEDVTTTKTVSTQTSSRFAKEAASTVEREGQSVNFRAAKQPPKPRKFHTQTEAETSTRGGRASAARETTTTRTAPTTSHIPASPEAAMRRVGDPQINRFAQELLEDVTSALEAAGAQEASVPAKMALELKEMIQQRAFSKGALREVSGGLSKETKKFAGQVAHQVRLQLNEAFGGSTSPFGRLMRVVDRKTRVLRREREFIGKNLEQTEQKLSGLYGPNKQSALRRIEAMENLFGVPLKRFRNPKLTRRPSDLIRQAEAESRVGQGGRGEIIPLITATGQFRSLPIPLGAGGGALIGGALGGPAGAVAGGALGLGATLAASPRSIIAMTRAANRMAPGMQRALGTALRIQLPTGARAAAAAGLAGIARVEAGKGASRQDHRPRTIRIGG